MSIHSLCVPRTLSILVIRLVKVFRQLVMHCGLLQMIFFVLYMSVLCLILMGNLSGKKIASDWIAFLSCSGSLRLKKGCVKGEAQGKLAMLLSYLDRFGGKLQDFQNVSFVLFFCGFCHRTLKREGNVDRSSTPKSIQVACPKIKPNQTRKTLQTENIFVKILLHLVHPVTFTVTEHLLKSCIFNVYFNAFWFASLYRIAPWQECVYVCASDLMLFFLVISKGV